MWDQSTYGGGTNANKVVGGFMQTEDSTEAKRQKETRLVPVTCAEVHVSTQHMNPHKIVLVGIIRSATVLPSRIDYQIDDYTGKYLTVREFVDDEKPRDTPMFSEQTYVKVFGQVRETQGQRNVVAFKIIPIEDMNEMTTHILQVIHSHMLDVKSRDPNVKLSQQTTAAAVVSGETTDKQVIEIMNNDPGVNGLTCAEIAQKSRGLSEAQVRKIVDRMIGDGYVYSTIDDDHFRATVF